MKFIFTDNMNAVAAAEQLAYDKTSFSYTALTKNSFSTIEINGEAEKTLHAGTFNWLNKVAKLESA